MANWIIVSALGPQTLSDTGLSGQAAIERMIGHWREQLDLVLPDQPDLIVVPETCDRFPSHSMVERQAYYAFRGNTVRDFFADTARTHHCYIAYAAARLMEDGTYRNSVQLIDRRGEVAGIYNKNHLVIDETEKGGILCGKDAMVFQTDFGRIACVVCFDLNFHELLEKYARQHPDLIVFSSLYHGGLMQNYWAYHCRAHFVAAVAGEECTVINPVGEKIAHSTNYFPRVTTRINLDCRVVHLDYNWEKLRRVKDHYGRGVNVFDPGQLGSVLLSSEMDDKSVDDVIHEFDIEPWDEYYRRSLQHRHAPGSMEA